MGFLAILLSNWKMVAVGLAVAAVVGYIGLLRHQVSSLKEDLAQTELVIAKYKASEEKLTRQAEAITKQHEAVLRNYDMEVAKNVKLTKDKIKLSKELNDTRVSLDAVRLFNESKTDSGATDAKSGDATEAGSAQTVPLAGIFEIVAENDANHLRCIKQVLEWQSLWEDIKASVQEVRSD